MILASEWTLPILVVAIPLAIGILIVILHRVLKSPFIFPYFVRTFDVSGKRNPQIENMIDQFIISGKFSMIEKANESIQTWKAEKLKRAENSFLSGLRLKQYYSVLDEENAFVFRLSRMQTRYQQRNYVKTGYQVEQTVQEFRCSFEDLVRRKNLLSKIGYECTLNEYFASDQRRLMTKELRREIMLRDNFTCQCCGKYMPDEVGLHIDHIIPVSKGGKSIASNLQVLCSKCNGKKSNSL